MAKPQRRVTSADVAKASGVSRATVSYVLNNDPRQTIPSETRERVLQAVRTLGYRTYAPARMLRAGYSRLVLGVLQFEQVDPDFARTIKELEARLAGHNFSIVWYIGARLNEASPHLSANLAPAVIISFVDQHAADMAAFLQQFNVPVLSRFPAGASQAVGQAQVAYLAERGQRQIVFAASERPDVQQLVQARLEGVQRACADRGLAPPITQVVPDSHGGARAAIAQVLAQVESPFGICCYNDEVAFAVLSTLADHGIAVPQSVAVIGCDDIPLAQFSAPSLTTIRFDNDLQLERLVGDVLAASQYEPLQDELPPALKVIVRASA